MKRLMMFPVFLIAMTVGNLAHSSSYQAGMNAALERDYVTALKIWSPLAERGDATPQFQLGWLYEQGYGVSKNYATAAEWYKRAAEQGYPYAQSAMGRMHLKGLGVPQDIQRAYMWLTIAASSWDVGARKMKESMSSTMTRSDILSAERLSHECVQKGYKGC